MYKNKRDQQIQLFLNEGRTVVQKSATQFDVKANEFNMQPVKANLEDLPSLQKYQKFHVRVKVIKKGPQLSIGQDVI